MQIAGTRPKIHLKAYVAAEWNIRFQGGGIFLEV